MGSRGLSLCVASAARAKFQHMSRYASRLLSTVVDQDGEGYNPRQATGRGLPRSCSQPRRLVPKPAAAVSAHVLGIVASMTGFARAEGEADGLAWSWELKSVNGKSLDLRFRLPAGF